VSVIAIAGRRSDGDDASLPRFPLASIAAVEQRVHEALVSSGARAIVSSAACGADLIALRAAGQLRLNRRVVLPFDSAQFRASSVIDRPGDWGPVFDSVIADVRAKHELVTLSGERPDEAAYAAANVRILDEAVWLGAAEQADVLAMLVWEGASRGDDDLTAAFGREAERRGLRVIEISTAAPTT
jgi:hypothetical protein